MQFTLGKKLSRAAVQVLIGEDARAIEWHPFVQVLLKDDRAYLRTALRGMRIEPSLSRALVLPSGRKVLLLGIASPLRHRQAIVLMRRMVVLARAERAMACDVHLKDFITAKGAAEDCAELFALQCELANFEFTKYKTPPKEGFFFVKRIGVHAPQGGRRKIEVALRRGKIIGEEINGARTLSNTPGGDMIPATVARAAVAAGKRCGFRVNILDGKAMARLKMGGVLGVAKGSAEKPKFIVMEYQKGPRREAPVVLVGKGVTFDSGGLNVKPGDMNEMHMDMSGGAAVIHIIVALARLKIKRNIVGLVPAVENMPSGSSYRPGDVLKTMSGKTIEVGNTDAEGRVILADALTYAKRYDPRLIVDIATLTGAAEVALGQRASAIFATDEQISRKMIASGEMTGDYVWPLPLWEEYEEDIKGTFGDVMNVGKTRYGGAITGAVFLWQFIKAGGEAKSPSRRSGQSRQRPDWVHLDIAPRMTSIEGDYLAKGAAGASIALLVQFLKK